MTQDTINQRFSDIERKICQCCGKIPETDGPPTGAPVGDKNVQFDPATGTFYYWDGDTWESVPIGTPGIDSVLAVGQNLSANRNFPLNGNQLTFTNTSSFGARLSATLVTLGKYLGIAPKVQISNSAATGVIVSSGITYLTISDTPNQAVLSNGKLGIGMTPSKTLDVTGTGGFTGDVTVPAEVYGVGWDGSLEVPTKNDVYDEMETKSDVGHTHIMTDVNDLPFIASGRFDPGLAGITNCDADNIGDFMFIRIGNIVRISGTFAAQAVTPGVVTIAQFSIGDLYASEFGNPEDAAGIISTDSVEENAGVVYPDSTSKLNVSWIAKDITQNNTWKLEATYIIIA